MRPGLRLSLGLLSLPLLMAAGSWVAGQLLYWWFDFQDRQADWHTWLAYARLLDHPGYRAHAWAIQTTGMIGLGAAATLWLTLLVALLRRPRRSAHGDARFAGYAQLARLGAFRSSDTGVLIGRHGRRYLRDHGQRAILLAAPTRSGKGVGVVVPVLLDYLGSVVVLDIKYENHALTSGYRQQMGQQVFTFSPFSPDGRTHRWNPLRYIPEEPAQRVGELRQIAHMLYPDGDGSGNQQFFIDHARNVFLALALYLFEQHDRNRRLGLESAPLTLGQLHRLASGSPTESPRARLQALAEEDHLSEACQHAFAGFAGQAEETLASILGTFHAPLLLWSDPLLDAATSGDDFLLTDVRRKRMSIYLCVSPDKLAQAGLIFNLFFSQLISLNTRMLPQQDPSLRHQCLLLMDEFTSLGKIDIIARAVGYMAGYNLRLLTIIQSMAQLDATYGREQARTLATNHATQILYAPREQQDANDYADMLGYTTQRRRQRSIARETSFTEVEERRALMLPQEIKALGSKRQILLIEGLEHPVLADKIRYYRERRFRRRLLKPVKPPPAVAPSHHAGSKAGVPVVRETQLATSSSA